MKLGHVHLKVLNLAEAENFYCGVLGLSVKERIGDTLVFLSFGAAHHDVALQLVPSSHHEPRKSAVGLYHTTFEVISSSSLLRVVGRLKEAAYPLTLVDHGISWAVYTEDPSGNGVELYLDRRHTVTGRPLWYGDSKRLTEEQLAKEA